MTGFETGINAIMNAMFNTTVFGQSWLMYGFIIMGTMMLITRRWKDWGILALPVMVGWKYFGLAIPTVFMVCSVVIFVLSILSLDMIAGAFSGLGEFAMKGTNMARRRRMDVKEEMKKLRGEEKAGGIEEYKQQLEEEKEIRRAEKEGLKRELDIEREKMIRKQKSEERINEMREILKAKEEYLSKIKPEKGKGKEVKMTIIDGISPKKKKKKIMRLREE